MTRAVLSVYLYGLHLIVSVGLPLILFPHFILNIFGLSAGDEIWIRFVGIFSAIVGAFCIAAVLTRTSVFLAWTVPSRYVTATFMSVMVALGEAGMGLLLFAALDALTASITWVAIRADQEEQAAA
jgi:hypothetical protein